MNRNEQAQAIQLAEHYLQNNSVDYARVILTKIISLESTHSKANELLAYIAGDTGDHQQALVFLQKACQSKDCSREALFHLGNLYLAEGDFENAIPFLKAALLKSQPFFEASHNLGLAFASLGHNTEAVNAFLKACELNPHSFQAFSNLGNSYQNLGLHEDALRCQYKALEINPQHPQCWLNLGVTLNALKRYEKALEAFNHAIQFQESYGEAWSNKGVTLNELGRHEEALYCQDKALVINPQDPDAWSNKGTIYLSLMRFNEALQACQKAIQLRPQFAQALYNEGIAFEGLKQNTNAIQSYQAAVKLKPNFQDAWLRLGNALSNIKQYQTALLAYQEVLKIQPDSPYLLGTLLHTKMLMCDWENFDNYFQALKLQAALGKKISPPFQFITLCDDEALQLSVTQAWAKSKHPIQPSSIDASQEPQSKIRIGYFSADFHNHATAYLMAEFFELHNKNNFEIYAFSYGPNLDDEMRRRLWASFDHFVDVSKLSDQAIAEQSQAMGINIAIDLKGYTHESRPGIFSYRTAPIQINYLGYPGTMGSEQIDYIIADRIVIPESSQDFFSEKIIYLPNSYQTNDSRRKVSDTQFTRSQLQLPENAFVFCCFNNSYKITAELFEVWVLILKAVPHSVLWLLKDNSWATENLRKEALGRGIGSERIIFAERMNSAEHLARQQLADLFLDTVPCNAHTTASDALWAGLPILTVSGNSFVGRVAASLLNTLELPELITHSLEEYKTLAIKLAIEPKILQGIKGRLAANCLTTPLFNTPLLTKHIEQAYYQIHKRQQNNLPPDHLCIN